MRHTQGKAKIVCTIGPATRSEEMLMRLIKKGMDVARLNFSHGSHEDHLSTLRYLRNAIGHTGTEVAVLQDLGGPKIRIGELIAPSVELRAGARVTVTTEPIAGTADRISTTFAHLPRDVRPGDTMLLDDGKLKLRVVKVMGEEVVCDIVVGGTLTPHKGINLPGVAISVPSMTEKDLQDLTFGMEQDVDYVALSFVRSAGDILALHREMEVRSGIGRSLPIIAKIEKPEAIANIDAIIEAADCIMVARGDLGVELPPEEVPLHQKMIIKKCNKAGKPVIIATQMLESMISSPTPTRAEASDVANAVLDGADALMLSAETSVGRYPVEAAAMMERIIERVEAERRTPCRAMESSPGVIENQHDALARAACVLAEQMDAAVIVAVTHSGETARTVARYRPRPTIVAVTDQQAILRKLKLIWGVHGMLVPSLTGDSDTALHTIQQHLLSSGVVRRGESVVLLAGQPFLARGSTNFIKVAQIK